MVKFWGQHSVVEGKNHPLLNLLGKGSNPGCGIRADLRHESFGSGNLPDIHPGKEVLLGRPIHPFQPTLLFRDEPFHPLSRRETSQPNWKTVDQFGGVEKNRGRVGFKRRKIRVPVNGDIVLDLCETGFLLLGQGWARFDDMELNNGR